MPKGKTGPKNSTVAELEREHRLLELIQAKRPTTYRQAVRIWEEARRNASTGEVVTSWAGVVS